MGNSFKWACGTLVLLLLSPLASASVPTAEAGEPIVIAHRHQIESEVMNETRSYFFAIESDREYTFNRKSGRTTSLTIQLPEFRYESRKVK